MSALRLVLFATSVPGFVTSNFVVPGSIPNAYRSGLGSPPHVPWSSSTHVNNIYQNGQGHPSQRAPRGTHTSQRGSGYAPKASPQEKALPSVPREAVLDSCRTTSLGMLSVAVALRQATHLGTAAGVWAYGDWTEQLPVLGCFDASHAGIALATAGAVTGARVALLGAWDDFAEATNRSLTQVLTPLDGPADLLQVSVLPAVGEELLFRGALIPALGGGWTGVAGAGAVFGALHVGGGRNSAFAAWAGAVGVLYGATGVLTGDVLVPVAAHAVSNYASAFLWKQKATAAAQASRAEDVPIAEQKAEVLDKMKDDVTADDTVADAPVVQQRKKGSKKKKNKKRRAEVDLVYIIDHSRRPWVVVAVAFGTAVLLLSAMLCLRFRGRSSTVAGYNDASDFEALVD
eukprot:gnl/TRDRNA2_/TRDRNA2_90303_c0_seq1.p1 gnl/TRDRNA2_/TRDRNA2_90303_c0~~gnl/TRDRNA2_/TRDRNA2_90303_c0_seq1.p1  ORF type:complete len:402 (-),score=69.69 gnl/TRDRNA2_/TRDRNA2_90303_c0_seq1:156-1361(-)